MKPMRWNEEAMSHFKRDRDLRPEGGNWVFHFENDRMYIYSDLSGDWRYIVPLFRDDRGHFIDKVVVNRNPQQILPKLHTFGESVEPIHLLLQLLPFRLNGETGERVVIVPVCRPILKKVKNSRGNRHAQKKFSWQAFIDSMDWDEFYHNAFGQQSFWEWDQPFVNGGSVFPINVKLTMEEMELVQRDCRHQEMNDHVELYFKDDMLYNIRSWTGDLDFIVRFEKTDDGYIICDCIQNDPDGSQGVDENPEHTAKVAVGLALAWIGGLCGEGRYEETGEDFDWVWHDPRRIPEKWDPDKKRYFVPNIFTMTSPENGDVFAVGTRVEGCDDLQPLRWTQDQMRALRSNRDLRGENGCGSVFNFEDDSLIVRAYGHTEWSYILKFEKDADGYFSKTALINCTYRDYIVLDLNPAEELLSLVDDLISAETQVPTEPSLPT
jgi:hypothetical protein